MSAVDIPRGRFAEAAAPACGASEEQTSEEHGVHTLKQKSAMVTDVCLNELSSLDGPVSK